MEVPKVRDGQTLRHARRHRTALYRIFDIYFDDRLQSSLSTPEGQAPPNDLPNFATGGVTIFISEVDSYLASSNLQLPVSQLRQPVVPLYGRPAVIKTPKWLNCKPVMKE